MAVTMDPIQSQKAWGMLPVGPLATPVQGMMLRASVGRLSS